MDVDQALQKLGRWGRWQTSFYVLLCVTGTFPAVWHMLAIVFIGDETTVLLLYKAHNVKRLSINS